MIIIHTADLHIDSPLRFTRDGAKRDARRAEIAAVFGRIANRAEELGASAVVIAGDLFDSGVCTPAGQAYVMSVIGEYPHIRFFWLRGNHDAGSSLRGPLPDNLHLFGKDLSCFDLGEGIRLYGSEDPSAVMEAVFPESGYNIAVMHGDVNDLDGKGHGANRLAGKNLDYLALGHFHTYRTGAIDGRGVWCYPGCPEGRGFDECGDKGFAVLTVESGKGSVVFQSAAKRRLYDLTVGADGCETYSELIGRCRKALEPVRRDDIARLTLKGIRNEDLPVDTDMLMSGFTGYYDLRFVDETENSGVFEKVPPENDLSLRGEFLRLLAARDDLSDEDREAVARIAVEALTGGRR